MAILSTDTRLRLEEIISRLSSGKLVTLQERIELSKYSSHIPYIAGKISQALRKRDSSEVD
tara:strand:+ start:27 stop:209 length:183 start_codon:yes stop_codon:yes gene_type:complete